MAVQPDGKIVVVGKSLSRFALARFESDGTLDASFGDHGTVAMRVSASEYGLEVALAVAVQTDGRIVVVGEADRGFVAVRYLPDGTLDQSFGDSGIVRTFPFERGSANAVVVEPDQGILVGGAGPDGFALARLRPDGSLDPDYGIDGVAFAAFSGTAGIEAMVLQGSGVVAAGHVRVDRRTVFAVARYAADGTLDATFGGDGLVTARACGRNSRANAIATDDDGRLLVAGSCRSLDAFALVRFSAHGVLDAGFGHGGVVETDVQPGRRDTVYAVASDVQGRVVVVGTGDDDDGDSWVIARYEDAGAPDTTFDDDGVLRLRLGLYRDGARAIAPRSDGTILVAGTTDGFTNDLAVALVDTGGALHPSFGVEGVGIADLHGGYDVANAVVRQPDGKLVAAGSADNEMALARYLSSGKLDPSFGDGGRAVLHLPDGAGFGAFTALSLLPDGRLVAVGDPLERGVLVARFLSDGSLDPTFGDGGLARSYVRVSAHSALALRADGTIVVGGDAARGFGLIRYLPTGELDPSFGSDGIVTTRFSADGDLRGLVTQSDGRVVAAGWSYEGFVVARYLEDGSLDPSFGEGGQVTTTFSSGLHGAAALTIQPDGMLVAAGQAGDDPCWMALARYETDGDLDPAFGEAGTVVTDLGVGCERASEVRVDPQGRIVAVGGAGRTGRTRIAVVRYLADGSLDTSFGLGGIVALEVSPATDWAYGLTIEPGGAIVAAGHGFSRADWVIARFLP
jgi:uncharacterized delta-60 repeat protein